ncbi:MAG: sulfatase-like hydrolase/transferase [Acidobacteriota bacterium]
MFQIMAPGFWKRVSLITVSAIYLYVFMEWLLFFTKPSFMSVLNWLQKGELLLCAPLPLVLVLGSWLLLVGILSLLSRNGMYRSLCLMLARLAPVLTLTSMGLLLVDNFTYTTLGLGVQSTRGAWRILYGLLCLLLVVASYRLVKAWETKLQGKASVAFFRLGVALPVLSSLVVGILSASTQSSPENPTAGLAGLKRQPSILVISSDGVNADHMSVYGYPRDTTPFLKSAAPRALICENAFSNAGPTGASIASLLTGRLPTQTRLIYPPDILTGEDVYRHLPAILKGHGYRSADISIRHYADAYDLNMRHGFDWANGREVRQDPFSIPLFALLDRQSAYFLDTMRDRLQSRTLHLAGWREMNDAFQEVVQAGKLRSSDPKRVRALLSFIDRSDGPFFAHVHLLGTHGARFPVRKRKFSVGLKQDKKWMTDFYDDAILTFDGFLEQIVSHLEKRGKLADTLIIVHSDHGQHFRSDVRIPLIFLFPKGEYNGRLQPNVQNLDVAPTLLDYLGLERPPWMEGESLIGAPIDPLRTIWSANRQEAAVKKGGWWEIDRAHNGPPFHSLGSVTAIVCQNAYRLDLPEGLLSLHPIRGHTLPCPPEELPTRERMKTRLLDHLSRNGYDVSSLK